MLKCELDVMEYAVTEETEFFDWLFEETPNDYTELHNSQFYRLVTSNVDAGLYELNLCVYDEWNNEVWHGIAGMYPYEWIDVKVLDYSMYNIGNEVYMDMWIK